MVMLFQEFKHEYPSRNNFPAWVYWPLSQKVGKRNIVLPFLNFSPTDEQTKHCVYLFTDQWLSVRLDVSSAITTSGRR